MDLRALPRSLDSLPGKDRSGYIVASSTARSVPPNRLFQITGLVRPTGPEKSHVPANFMLHLDGGRDLASAVTATIHRSDPAAEVSLKAAIGQYVKQPARHLERPGNTDAAT